MAVSSTNSRVSYTSVGETTFAYPFKVFAGTDLQVYDNAVLKTITADYTVTGVGSDTGGNVIFNVATVAGHTILIIRVLPQTQASALPLNDKFPSTVVETMADKLTLLVQQLNEVDTRSLKVPVTSAFSNLSVPDPVVGKTLRWNPTSTGLENFDVVAIGGVGLPLTRINGGFGADASVDATARSIIGAAQALTVQVLTPGASVTIDAATGDYFTLVPAQAFTLANPTNPTNGKRIVVRIKQDGTGTRILTLGSAFRLGVDIPTVVLSTAAGKVDYIGAIFDSTDAKWDIVAFTKGF